MVELIIKPIFQEVTSIFKDEEFSVMYFGRHCGKNVLILKHDLSIMLVFGENIQCSDPEFIKSISTRGDSVKGVQIVGSKDVILMLDESGKLWRLINAFDVFDERLESLYSLANNCYYEWVPFKKFNFAKVLALCELKEGFACVGLNRSLDKKLAVLPAMDSPVEEFTFDGLNAADSFSFYLMNLDVCIQNTILESKIHPAKETLLVTDRFKGRTYMCTKDGKSCLINQSNMYLISALHYPIKKCVILCFESGKLIFYFYNDCDKQCVVHLPEKLVDIEQCQCFDFCMLWSDGINLHHTKLSIEYGSCLVKAIHLKLIYAVQSPLALLQVQQGILVTTINSIYYLICPTPKHSVKITKYPKELLNKINECSWNIDQLELNIDTLSHYLYCKGIMEDCKMKEKIGIIWEKNHFIMKISSGICLRHEFWKLRLKAQVLGKELVHLIEFKTDLSDGMYIMVDNPFRRKCIVKASLIGNFGDAALFFYLGEVSVLEDGFKEDQLSKQLENILNFRSSLYKGVHLN